MSSGLTPGQRRVAEILMANQHEAAFLGIEELAERAGSSVATVVRFAKSLGYAGFLDAAQVNEAELGRLYDYDLALKQTLAQIEAAADAVTGGTQQDFDQTLRQLGDEIEEFSRMLDHRSEAATGLAP